jgi:conjugal transfer ATP-binding protein TraC
MSYEIPSEIAYQEKIAFGLTMRQLAQALLFGSSAYLLGFHTDLPNIIKWPVTGVFLALGTGFVYFDLGMKIKNFIDWVTYFNFKAKNKKILNFLGIKKFENDYFSVNGKKTAVLEIKPRNFSIKNKADQEVTIKIFRKLLQSIDYPIQYYIKTENLNVDQYLQQLRKRVNIKSKLYKEHFESMKKHLLDTISDNRIINRNFYIIIPEKKGLDIQVRLIQEKIKTLGLQSKRLKKKQLEELALGFLRTKTQDEIIRNELGHLKVGKSYHRAIVAKDYPRYVEPGFLDKVITSEGDFDISIHVQPREIDTMMVNLNRELQKQRADLYGAQVQGKINPSLEIQFEDTRNLLKQLQKGQDRLYDVSLYINCRASTMAQLNYLTGHVESQLNSVMIRPKVLGLKQIQGIKSIAPIGKDILKIRRNIPATALSAFFPFTSKFLEIDNTGIWFGQNKNNIPLIIDPFKFSNPNGVILASSGAGKSYLAKLLISRQLLNGTQVFIIDPQGEYSALVKKYGGKVVDLHTKSKSMINPLDLMGKSYHQKRLFLMDLGKIMFVEHSTHMKALFDKAAGMAYKAKGITDDPKTWNKDPPIMEDVLKQIRVLKKDANKVTRYPLFSLESKIELYCKGVFDFLNRHTSLELKNQLVCFNIFKLPKQIQPVIMFLILDYVYTKMQKNFDRKILVIDEAWKLLSRAEEANYILEIVKTCRKFNMGLLLINQEVEDLIQSGAGKSVLANSSYTVLLKQKPAVIKELNDIFDLSEYERDFLVTANVGEGILRTEKDQTELRVLASQKEHEFITTNADEKLNKGGK